MYIYILVVYILYIYSYVHISIESNHKCFYNSIERKRPSTAGPKPHTGMETYTYICIYTCVDIHKDMYIWYAYRWTRFYVYVYMYICI
jgi:hypothetical protein